MQRKLFNILHMISVFLFLVFVLEASQAGFNGGAQAAFLDLYENSSILRLHIVANSDTGTDQTVKLKVRDALLKQFAPAASLVEAESILLNKGADVLTAVERVLAAEGCVYKAQLRYGKMTFPEKKYGETIYPAGEYAALRVELGAASGENWWCVLFPPLCLLDIGVTDLRDNDNIEFESDLMQWLGLLG